MFQMYIFRKTFSFGGMSYQHTIFEILKKKLKTKINHLDWFLWLQDIVRINRAFVLLL